MNLIGKIFIVLIFIMSLCGMVATVAVYSAHHNWKEVVDNPPDKVKASKPLGLSHQLVNSRAERDELQEQYNRLASELEAEKSAATESNLKLINENVEIGSELDKQEKANAALKQQVREAVAAMESTQKSCETLRTEVDKLREKIRTTQADRLVQFNKVVELTDLLHQEVNARTALKQLNTTLSQDFARAMEVLRQFRLENNPANYSGEPPVGLDGVVLASRSNGLVELSLGSDDGLKKGHSLNVTRGATYLGRVTITDVEPDKAVALIVPELNKGAIERGDRVASSQSALQPST